MTTIRERVIGCFCALFPTHSREELLVASRASIPEWDSMAGVTLLSLLQEEFHLDIDLSELEHFDSVQAVLDYVSANVAAPVESNES